MILATKDKNNDSCQPVLRTMPLCPFAKQAHYSGKDSVNSAANWSCADNEDLLQVGANGVQAGLAAQR